MWLAYIKYPLALLTLACINPVAAADGPSRLLYNPFSKPEILAPPEKKPIEQKQAAEQSIELQLTATLVSDIAPLVIIEGQMLGIGDQIEGYQLLSVEENSAVFEKESLQHSFELIDSGVNVE